MRHRCCHCSAGVIVLAFAAVFLGQSASAQQGPVNGMRPADVRTHAITNATVVTAPGEVLENATILIRRGLIEAVGEDVDVPAEARRWDGEGLTVYAGLIDAAVLLSAEDTSGAGAHWNERVRPEIAMAEQDVPSAGLRSGLRAMGFTAAAVYPDEGVWRGSGAVLALAEDDEHVLAYRERAAMAAAFEYGGRGGSRAYPGSLMGAIALMRQTLLDAQWHAQAMRVYNENPNDHEPPMRADAPVAMRDVIAGRQRVLFDAEDELDVLRAGEVAREFDLDMIVLGSGMEFRRLEPIVALNMPIIVPVEFPDRPKVATLAQAEGTSLREMQTWEQAPTNARRLAEAGATITLTTHRLDRRSEFPAAVRRVIQHGLSEDDALAALTITPARLLGIDSIVGTIEPGKLANLVVVEGSLFEKGAKVRDTWVNGRRHEISRDEDITFTGAGTLQTSDGRELPIDLDTTKSRATLHLDEDTKASAKNVIVQRDQVSLLVDGRAFDVAGYVRLSGVISGGSITGSGALPDGSLFTFTIEPDENREAAAEEDDTDKADTEDDSPQENQSEKHDGISGTWALDVRIDDVDESLPVSLSLQQHDDGSITGVSVAMDFETPVTNAVFDEDAGELRYQLQTPEGMTDIVANVQGNEMTGTFTGPFAGNFTGSRSENGASSRDAVKDEDAFEMPPDELAMPLGEYGVHEQPSKQNVLVRGGTIWTAGPAGIIDHGVLLVVDGQIAFVGSQRQWDSEQGQFALENVTEIDAQGKHISPGLIDCHSHTGISRGINEWTQVNTAEVRIADVINPDDINWYRQLAGGLTAANQLHGSANPIGGQNSVVKLKWGVPTPGEMRIDDAIEGIKFALGENVVRSRSRYPNTRMGVETVLRDAFTAAREYERKRTNDDDGMPVRRELELDALVEILNGERLVHCHSYRQDEILMLIRVAEDFGFTIGSFQHVLEGYKVAEAIAEHQADAHGAGASAFSDWWGYKVEVQDAIAFAGALMHEVGVNVSFNSDSSEVARRMNTEAAKAVRYGGVSPHDALKFVTINPAAQLRIDHRTGSLETGKDADFVIWSGDPLSTYTRAEQTWIEGAKYFDLETDRTLRAEVNEQRQRLIQKILIAQHGEATTDDADADADEETDNEAEEPERRLMQRLMDNRAQMMAEEYRRGRDPEEIRPGECGCDEWWYQLR